MQGIKIDLIVPDRYKTLGAETNSTFTVPMFNYEYTIEYTYSTIAYDTESASGQQFPHYTIAKNLNLISKYNLQWSGLLNDEKEIFDAFIKAFNNSFQPFTMRVFTDTINYNDYTMIIESDNLSISKDKFDLWSINLQLILII